MKKYFYFLGILYIQTLWSSQPAKLGLDKAKDGTLFTNTQLQWEHQDGSPATEKDWLLSYKALEVRQKNKKPNNQQHPEDTEYSAQTSGDKEFSWSEWYTDYRKIEAERQRKERSEQEAERNQ
jgi:hypothetical protein